MKFYFNKKKVKYQVFKINKIKPAKIKQTNNLHYYYNQLFKTIKILY